MNVTGCDCSRCRAGLPCDCCVGTKVVTPVGPCNRPGLDAIVYRVGTYGQFFETMKARLSTMTVEVVTAQPDGTTATAEYRPLTGLTTRERSDFSIALLDAAAVVGDVLTFYQERIANEGYLRTATERRSVLELARLVGYAARPGVASTVYLAYTIDDKQADPVTIPIGARSQSVPGPGDTPQSFETVEALEARATWNTFAPRTVRTQTTATIADGKGNGRIYLQGSGTNLKVNDVLLIDYGDQEPLPYRVLAVVPDPAQGRTLVTFSAWPGSAALTPQAAPAHASVGIGVGNANADPAIGLMKQLSAPASIPPRNALALARDLGSAFANRADIGAQIVTTFLPDLKETLSAAQASSPATPGSPIRVYVLRQKAALFGSNLPGQPNYVRDAATGMISISFYTEPTIDTSFGGLNASGSALDIVALDSDYERIGAQGWAVIVRPPATVFQINAMAGAAAAATDGAVTVHRVTAVKTGTLSAFGAATKSTQLTVDPGWMSELSANDLGTARGDVGILRGTVVYAQSEELTPAAAPIVDDVCHGGAGTWIELDGYYSDLKSGRWVVVAGERADITTKDPATGQPVIVSGVRASELVMLSNVIQAVATQDGLPVDPQDPSALPGETLHTFIQFAKDLGYCYARDKVTIYGNVVKATHGETQNEVLGNGDGAKALQTFTLKKPPLTFMAAPTAAGAASTLHAYVNDVEWHESDSLAWLGASDHGFATLTDHAGNTTLTFGNGEHGARLPTGLLNVVAVYRSGIGAAGNVSAEQISQLQTRPLGVKAVINPQRASGGADKESRDLARENAPLSVMPLDRLVSVQDYADFTRRFAGIGKAVAQRTTDGRRQLVYLTIAGVDDGPIDKTSDLYRNLLDALLVLGDPDLPLRVELRELKMLVLSAKIQVAPDYVWDKVGAVVRARLLDAFGFGKRALGQWLLLSEVVSVIQSVSGVEFVDVDALGAIPEMIDTTAADGTAYRRPRTPAEVLQSVQDITDTGGAPRLRLRGPRDVLPRDVAAWPGGSDRGVLRPAELVVFAPDIPDTLILNPIS